MEPNNYKDDLLQEVKKLRFEKKLLEKHVFVLNECLTPDELKRKISSLEKKQEMIVSLEGVLERLRAETEPLNYLKSILENKTSVSNETNITELELLLDLKPSNPEIDLNVLSPSTDKSKFQSTQSIPEQTKIDLTSIHKNNEITSKTTLASANEAHFSSIDEYTQLMEQYDVVTVEEVLKDIKENSFTTQNDIQEPFTSDKKNLDIEVQNKQSTTSTYFDAEGINVELKNEKHTSSAKGNIEPGVNNITTPDFKKADEHSSQLNEASTSQLFQNQDSFYSDLNVSIGDLLLKIPQQILQQGINSVTDYVKVQGNSNEFLKNVVNVINDNANELLKHEIIPDVTPVMENDIKKLLIETGNFINNCSADKFMKTNQNESSEKTESSEIDINKSKTINIKESTEQAESIQQNESPKTNCTEIKVNSFNDMNLKIDILRGIYSLGLINPTDLQERVIVHCLNGQDVIVFAGPNTGRTILFVIPLLQRIKISLNECQALVLVPTRELAVHIQKTITSVGDYLGVNVCIGGDNVPRKLPIVPHVVVGTPAGVSNMITCKSLSTVCIQTVVLNKADEMLTHHQTKLIDEIMDRLVRNKQVTVLTSDKLDQVLDKYMDALREPLIVFDDRNNEKKDEILKSFPKQFYMNIQEEWKLNAFCEMNEILNIQQAVIFCNTLNKAQMLCESLKNLKYAVSLFHLDMSAKERENTLALFSSNILRILITTDSIKGSHFHSAPWIINYDLPSSPISYMDRIAKCAKNGKVLNLINDDEENSKSAIETLSKSFMIQMPLNLIDILQY